VVKVGDKVRVRVLEVDLPRRRIALSIKRASEQAPAPQRPASQPKREPRAQAKPSPKQKPQPKPPAAQPFNNPFAKLGSLKR
jgi:uncharacterized protein